MLNQPKLENMSATEQNVFGKIMAYLDRINPFASNAKVLMPHRTEQLRTIRVESR